MSTLLPDPTDVEDLVATAPCGASQPKDDELDIHALARPLAAGTTLIEASAGTGKTYTIAAIFLRLIVEHGLRGDEILVTTFTIPATAELRERIRHLLRRALAAFRGNSATDPLIKALLASHASAAEETAARLEAALHDFDQARIHTIHGFCQRVLAECAFESGAAPDPDFVLDEGELVREVARDYWRRQFYDCEECLAAAARCQKLSVGSLAELLTLRLRQPLARIIPVVDPARIKALRHEITGILDELRDCWQAGEAEIRKPFFEANTWSKAPYSNAAFVRQHWAGVASCLKSPEAALTAFESLLHFSSAAVLEGTRKRPPSPAPCHAFHDLCDRLCKLGAEYKVALEADFLAWAPTRLAEQKLRANVTSFSDLLSRLHAELHSTRGPALAGRIRGQYRAALIDEFQDTDALQESIFQRVFGGAGEDSPARWLFLIGDPKQAIYGFRGADVYSYLAAAKRAERRLTLKTNFRSTQALVAGTNAIFESNPRAFVAEGIGFESARASGGQEAQTFSGDGIVAPLRIWTWEVDEGVSVDTVRAELAQATAAEISRLLSGKAKVGTDAVRAEHIAVLTASNDEAILMQQALRGASIPSVLLSNSSVFASPEAADLLCVLAALAQPTDERRVRAALLTELLGVRLTELQALSGNEPQWERKLQQFHGWHEAWTRSSFIAAFRRVMRDAGIRTRLVAFADGERRLTNLAHLSELVQCAASEEQLAPSATVEWLAQRVAESSESKRAQDEEHELRLERDDEAVRIITVHKSKGLQYEIVFCPFSWRGLSGKDGPRASFHEPGGGVVLDLGSDDLDANRERERSEKLAEEVRLLYVAVTRARVRCDLALPYTAKASDSAATWLLQAPPEEAATQTALLKAHYASLGQIGWRQNLDRLAARSAGSIALVDVPDQSIAAPRVIAKKKAAGHARRFTGDIERDFCVSSFSSLTEAANADVPEKFVAPAGEDQVKSGGADDIHAFPAGARAGLCLHEIFERLDFADLSNLETLVGLKLGDYSFDPARWTPAVADCLRRVVATPLPDGFTLAETGAGSRLVEREFHLPAGKLEPAGLREILGGDEPGGLEFAPRRGWLKGFIDLIFRHGERFYVADWKSNRLGASGAAYTPEAVEAAMKSHHYGLQAHLYALALHRYLRQRQQGYDYERHFGGMLYFFVRGADPERPDMGLWRQRPELKTVLALEAWLEGREP